MINVTKCALHNFVNSCMTSNELETLLFDYEFLEYK
jgi:hypothetical protein